jgi:hypothetical protein
LPFIRQTRDKRGYEVTYVMHAYRPQVSGGPVSGQTRVLYLFRTPGYVKLGRRPLDEEAREALTHTHPDLTFDWNSLGRSLSAPRLEPVVERSRPEPRQRRQREQPAAALPVVLDDETLLGRVLGAVPAAELRQRYQGLLQQIGRRARTPEDRHRLVERVQRLNPDDWPDEAAIRASVETVAAEWEAVQSELPIRRRGRRGGRNRPRGRDAQDSGASAIIEANGEIDGNSEPNDVHVAPRDSPSDSRDGRDAVGAAGPGADPTGDGVSGGD